MIKYPWAIGSFTPSTMLRPNQQADQLQLDEKLSNTCIYTVLYTIVLLSTVTKTGSVFSVPNPTSLTILYPGQAIFDTLDCDPPPEFEPLLSLIGSITELAYVIGLSLAVLALLYAGLVMIWGSEETKRKAKKRTQNVLLGVILILMANTIIVFLARSMGDCGGVS